MGRVSRRKGERWERGGSGSCEQQGREPAPLCAGPRVFETLRFEQLEELLAGCSVVPIAVALDDLEERIGGCVDERHDLVAAR